MDDLLLSKIRLAVASELATADWIAFSELVATTETTPGNMGTHLAELVEAGYVTERKRFAGRRPLTTYRLSALGKRALVAHADWLQAVVMPFRTKHDRSEESA